ncbi:MAG: methyltransferase domain-containing protein [Acidimicrobiales bacterium]
MTESERRHRRLIDGLRHDGALLDPRIEEAFRAVRRHWFLPGVRLDDVYRDRAVVTHRDHDGVPVSSSSQPVLMARMLAQLDVHPGMAVLEIGTGTGYNAALLGQLVGPGGRVLTLDLDPAITGPAQRHLSAAGASNVTVETADGWDLGSGGRFDRIVATVGVWDLAPAWAARLEAGGRLVVPLWLRAGQQASVAFKSAGVGLDSVGAEPCGFMRLRGPGAGEATYRRLGPWTVSLDHPDPTWEAALSALLDGDSSARPAPALDPGWFSAIALTEPGAVHLFTETPTGAVIRSGLLQLTPPAMAVVESHPPAPALIRTFGHAEPLDRLVHLMSRRPALDPSTLSISALPTGSPIHQDGAIATLVRPNFTFVVRAGGGENGPRVRG